MAVSKKADKKKLKKYHFFDEDYKDIPVDVNAAANGNGWEIDVVDANNQVIRVCAELVSPTTCDNTHQINSDHIYVINTGAGAFDLPTGMGGKLNRLVYENKVPKTTTMLTSP
jgi:hypothetical protein